MTSSRAGQSGPPAYFAGGGDRAAARAPRATKRRTGAIGEIEGYGIPPLHCHSRQAVFLNDVLPAMHGGAGLPFPCPAASCTSSEYYLTHPPAGTVHAPSSEAAFLPHMPDFYRELGHPLLDH